MEPGRYGLGKFSFRRICRPPISSIPPEEREVREPFVLCQGGVLVWGDIDAARAQGREHISAIVLDAEAGDEKLIGLRQEIIDIKGKDW